MSGIKYGTLREMAETANKYGPRIFQVKLLASPAAVATIVVTEQSITVTGINAGDIVLTANKPTMNGAIGLLTGRAAANAFLMTFVNPTAGSITPTAAEVYDLVILRPPS